MSPQTFCNFDVLKCTEQVPSEVEDPSEHFYITDDYELESVVKFLRFSLIYLSTITTAGRG